MSVGIYKITNDINFKFYVGQSVNIEKRFESHKQRAFSLNSKEYESPMYADMRLFGTEHFHLDILELCPKELLHEREVFWIKFLDAQGLGYNITKGGLGVKNIGESHPNHRLTLEDVKSIRERYRNHERKQEVYLDFRDKISKSGFHKIWNGTTWPDVMSEVFTPENKSFHKHNTANKNEKNGRAVLSDEDVATIRLKRKLGYKSRDVYKSYSDKLTYGSFANIWFYQNWKDIIV